MLSSAFALTKTPSPTAMASTAQSHPSFAQRPYSSSHGKLPDRGTGNFAPAASKFAQTTHASSRETARLERERQAQAGGGRENSAPVNPVTTISDEQKEEINEAFGLFDLDKDQRLDYHEFKVALKALGFDLPKPEILSLLNTHGVDRDSPPSHNNPSLRPPQQQMTAIPAPRTGRLVIPFLSFQSVAAVLINQRDPRDEILRAFTLFDTEGKGIISIEDLRRVARELGEGLDEEELQAMIEEFDLEGKGGVGREEFIGICMG